jgi:hypothetical protein
VTIRSAFCRVLIMLAATVAMPALSIAQMAPDVLPPRAIVNIVRAAGLEPVSRPSFRGTTYVLQGVDESNELVRVIVDSRSGRVLSVRPLIAVGARPSEPGPSISLRRPFGGRAVYGGSYLGDEFAPVPPRATLYPPNPPSAVRTAPQPGARTAAVKPAQPPLPRPKPQSDVAAKTAPTAPTAPVAEPPAAAMPAAAQPKTSELATGSVTPKPSTPAPTKPAAEFPPMQTLE